MPRAASALTARLIALASPADHALREAEIFSALEDESPAVREVAIAWAARCIEPARLAPLVASPDNAILRNAALAALTRQGPYAIQHVGGMLEDPDPDVVMFACQVLGEIKAVESWPALLRLLKHEQVNVVQAAIEALGRVRAREAVPRLIEILGEEPWLQLAATDALGEIGDPLAAPVLVGLVPESFVTVPALAALRKIAAAEAAEPLLTLLFRSDTVELRSPIVLALAASLQPGMPLLERLGQRIDADRDGIWRYLAAVLQGEVSGEEPLDPLNASDDRRGTRGGGPLVRAAATLALAGGLESLHPWVVRWAVAREGVAWQRPLVRRFHGCLRSTLGSLLAHPDVRVRQGALEVGELTSDDFSRIVGLLRDESDQIRAATCRAIGPLKAVEAIPDLLQLLQDSTGQDRDAAAAALGHMPAEDLELSLAPFLQSDVDEAVRLRAIRVVEHSGCRAFDPEILETAHAASPALRRAAFRVVSQMDGSRAEVLLLRALADPVESVQTEVLDLLAKRPGGRTLATLLALLNTNDSLRYHVIRALGRLGAAQAAGPLQTLYGSALLHEKIEILAALASIASPGTIAFLRQRLEESQVEIRRVAAQGLADLAGSSDLPLFSALAEDPDWAIRNEAARALGRLRVPERRSLLLALARDLEPVVARTALAALSGEPEVAASAPA
jgi:HEAT repeat protein